MEPSHLRRRRGSSSDSPWASGHGLPGPVAPRLPASAPFTPSCLTPSTSGATPPTATPGRVQQGPPGDHHDRGRQPGRHPTISGGPKQNLFWAAVIGDPGVWSAARTATAPAFRGFHAVQPPTWTNSSYPTTSWVTPWSGAPSNYPSGYKPNDWVYTRATSRTTRSVGIRQQRRRLFFRMLPIRPLLVSAMNYAFKIAIGTPQQQHHCHPERAHRWFKPGQRGLPGQFPAARWPGGVVWPAT